MFSFSFLPPHAPLLTVWFLSFLCCVSTRVCTYTHTVVQKWHCFVNTLFGSLLFPCPLHGVLCCQMGHQEPPPFCGSRRPVAFCCLDYVRELIQPVPCRWAFRFVSVSFASPLCSAPRAPLLTQTWASGPRKSLGRKLARLKGNEYFKIMTCILNHPKVVPIYVLASSVQECPCSHILTHTGRVQSLECYRISWL